MPVKRGRPRREPHPISKWCPTCHSPPEVRCRFPRGEAKDINDCHRTRYRAAGWVRAQRKHRMRRIVREPTIEEALDAR